MPVWAQRELVALQALNASPRTSHPALTSAGFILHLQRVAGNAAVAFFLRSTANQETPGATEERSSFAVRNQATPEHVAAPYGVLAVQRKPLSPSKLNLAGEHHDISGARRDEEEQYARQKAGGNYWKEKEFRTGVVGARVYGDPKLLRAEQRMTVLNQWLSVLRDLRTKEQSGSQAIRQGAQGAWALERPELADALLELSAAVVEASSDPSAAAAGVLQDLLTVLTSVTTLYGDVANQNLAMTATQARQGLLAISADYTLVTHGKVRDFTRVSAKRGRAMHQAAQSSATVKGVWKVGNAHIGQIKTLGLANTYELLSQDEFEDGFKSWRRWGWLGL